MIKFFIIFFSILLAFSSCKKEEIDIPPIPETIPSLENIGRGSNDETARMEYNKIIDLVSFVYELNYLKMNGLDLENINYPCGLWTVDTLGGRLNLKFTGECGSSVLSGKATVVEVNNIDWSKRQSKLLVKLDNYKVVTGSNNEELIFNGYFTLENSHGGLISLVIRGGGNLDYIVRGSLDITFDNNETRTWRITQKRRFHDAGSNWENIQLQVTADSNNSIAESGKNKYGYDFTTTYQSTIESYSCNTQTNWIPNFTQAHGKYTYQVGSTSVTVEAGFTNENDNLNPVHNCESKGLKINWNFSNGSKETFFAYN